MTLVDVERSLIRRVMGLAGVVALTATTGCGGAAAAGAARHEHQLDTLRQRAAFDLRCPAEQLVLTPLHPPDRGWVFTYGVSGCGSQESYSQIPQQYDAQWHASGNQTTVALEEQRRQEEAAARAQSQQRQQQQ